MIVQIIKDRYQTEVNQNYNEQDLTFEDLIEIVKSPSVSDTKNNTGCLVPFDMHYSEDNIELVQSNAYSYTMLIFDSDIGYTIEEFIEQFKEYQFVLFTTFSHTEDQHRFKAFFPLKQPLKIDTLRTKFFKSWMQKKYPFNDEGVLKFFKCYLPNCKSLDTYRYHINEGRQYHFDDFKDEILKSKEKHRKIDMIKDARRKSKEAEFAGRNTKTSVRNNQKVRAYLDSPISPTGYGQMAFTAIAVCCTANDTDTLERVKDKMSMDSFTQDEIYRMINNARR